MLIKEKIIFYKESLDCFEETLDKYKYLLDQGLSLYDEDKLGNTPLDSIVESEELMLPFLEPYLKKETNR